jgi:hypothetical protein
METNQTLKRQTSLGEFMTPLEEGVVRSGNLASTVVSVLEPRRPRTKVEKEVYGDKFTNTSNKIKHQHSAFDLSASQSSELSERGNRESLFIGVVGWAFGGSRKDEESEPTFICQTQRKKGRIKEHKYLQSQIKIDLAFKDGVVKYPDNKIPDLDRDNLTWDERLVGRQIQVLWRRTNQIYIAQISSYDWQNETHCLNFTDGDKMEANLMGSRHSSISEWKLIEKQCTFFSDHPEIACKIIEVPFG